MPLQMNAEQLMAFFEEVFPQLDNAFEILRLDEMELDMRMKIGEAHLRPGGTVSGPTMFTLADCIVYSAVLAMIGPKALSVTTSSSMDFMRKPAAGVDLIGKCKLLKLGRALAVGDVLIYSEGMEKPVARATLTYSIPPK